MKRPSKLQSLVYPLAVLLSILFVACDNDSEDESSYDVYAFGRKNENGTFWRNGVEHPEPLNAYFLIGSFVDGEDFYVAGAGPGKTSGKSVAKYWKNGNEVALSNGAKDERAYDVAVLGSDVYSVGYEDSPIRAKYWKNTSEVFLVPNSSNNASGATDIQIAGSDFYILGWENVNNNDSIVARLWKNGKHVHLEHDSVYYFANEMLIDGSDVYLFGYQSNKKGFRRAAFWKNGSLIDTPPVSGSYPMLIKGGDRYSIQNFVMSEFGYLKNDKFTQLQTADVNTYVASIDVVGSDVIVAGNNLKDEKPCGIVWKNGVPVAPFLGNDPTIWLEGAVAVKRR